MRPLRPTNEPAAWIGALTALLGLLVAFHVPLTADQQAAILGLLPAVSGLVIRSQVSPARRRRRPKT